MVDVDKSNFLDYLPDILESIDESDFIAFDSEFTTLVLSDDQAPSLFDDGESRYRKLKQSVAQSAPVQIGLSMFKQNRDDKSYAAKTFNFYLCPQSFGPVDVRFTFQASSLKFLANYNFDFNKFVYGGIGYLNEIQLNQTLKCIENKNYAFHSNLDEEVLQTLCSTVAKWLIEKSCSSDPLVLNRDEIKTLPSYIVEVEIQERFPEVFTELQDDGRIKVERVSEIRKNEGLLKPKIHQLEKFLEELLGFTRVFNHLIKAKKPLVGHNCLMDLLIIYEKFYKPLPTYLSQFKEELHLLFPFLYDTKHISFNLKKAMIKTDFFDNTTLGTLYEVLNREKARFYYCFGPSIYHSPGFTRYIDNKAPHEAGFDAFMTGSVFLRMAHMFGEHNSKLTSTMPKATLEHFKAMEDFVNCCNVIHAAVPFLNFNGLDPRSRRPEYLVVEPVKSKDVLGSRKLAEMFSKHGSVDIQLVNIHQALVAVSNYQSARQILKAYKNNKHFRVEYYSVLKHSPAVKRILWCGLMLTGGFFVWSLYDVNKPRIV